MTLVDPFNARVLLIEDEAFIRHTIRRLLRSLGNPEIREAADGTAAMEILRDNFDPDIILCDVQMAPMDGYTFLKALRGVSNPVLASTQVIILTASADLQVVRRFGDLGIRDYLLKPVSRQQLAEHITAAIRHSEAAHGRLAIGSGTAGG